ncbi:voltage-gated potassium channel [Haloferula luteola]|uniref:Voltage-gated potassium channel n=1 Tax=Haloferula luteola TaxID=595692 RepID=A0A840V4N3_9BACT|nr:ion transporter [Haloferula luteola]MBB5352006.1 voltage-gated potassium channel [Haloferula luteola]
MSPRREKWREIIFEAETPAGKAFDVILLGLILVSVAAVMVESIKEVRQAIGYPLWILEWIFTGIFTFEYVARLWASRRPWAYARSFYGVVDLLSILPSFIGLLLPGGHALMIVRILRVLRIFRVLKMVRHINGAELLMRALYASRAKITVFFTALATIALIFGTLLYLVEGEEGGFTSIPVGVYWAIVTITTLGYGDISPSTGFGQMLTAFLALTGYAIIAVPTGIVSAEISKLDGDESTDACPSCGVHGHLPDARFCRRCGAPME